MSTEPVRYVPSKASVDPTFWAKFAELKLDKYRLDDKLKIELWGKYSLKFSDNTKGSNRLMLDCMSFNENIDTSSCSSCIICRGYMLNTNTYEAYKQIKPQEFIDSIGKCIINDIVSGAVLEEPWKLTVFLVSSFADLKTYKFQYWIAHPTPLSLPAVYYEQLPKPATEVFTEPQMEKIRSTLQNLDYKQKAFFSIIMSAGSEVEIVHLSKGVQFAEELAKTQNTDQKVNNTVYFAFYDSNDTCEPGWQLRNFLCLLFYHCPTFCCTKTIRMFSWNREDFQITPLVYMLRSQENMNAEDTKKAIANSHLVGWEQNENGKLAPRLADLSDTLDPAKLSERAISLNLKLMKWRLAPNLNLEKINGLKCLLLGAGTLGCSVARVLLGWGVNNITFVDRSVVSPSNTVRQSLYIHEDAVKRKLKVDAAKEALLKIRPNMNVQGVNLQIPMPGHVVGQSLLCATKESFEKLEQLVSENNVVFLLMDSREARWLPTLMCAAMNKIVINAALGFDTFMVQRHGTRLSTEPSSPDITVQNPTGQNLGCYFCNDVTQPGNSQADRTLDQQCTVSRPGLSQIAAGLAVELMIAITQHPQGIEARALTNHREGRAETREESREELEGVLGGVPHTIRGALWEYEMCLTVTHRFPSCTACSTPLINEYRNRGFEFVLDACNVPNYLEKLSGVEEILRRSDLDELCDAIDASSEDEEQSKVTA